MYGIFILHATLQTVAYFWAAAVSAPIFMFAIGPHQPCGLVPKHIASPLAPKTRASAGRMLPLSFSRGADGLPNILVNALHTHSLFCRLLAHTFLISLKGPAITSNLHGCACVFHTHCTHRCLPSLFAPNHGPCLRRAQCKVHAMLGFLHATPGKEYSQ